MQFIDIPAVIEARGLSKAVVAAQLFPNNKHPRLALNRVIQGKGYLNELQINKLALLADVSRSSLTTLGPWAMRSKDTLVTFTNEDFRAELDTSVGVTRLFDNNSLFHETVLTTPSITLTEYLAGLSDLILKFRTNE